MSETKNEAKEFVDSLYDDPEFVGLVIRRWFTQGDERVEVGNPHYVMKGVGRDHLLDLWRRHETDLDFEVAPVFRRSGEAVANAVTALVEQNHGEEARLHEELDAARRVAVIQNCHQILGATHADMSLEDRCRKIVKNVQELLEPAKALRAEVERLRAHNTLLRADVERIRGSLAKAYNELDSCGRNNE